MSRWPTTRAGTVSSIALPIAGRWLDAAMDRWIVRPFLAVFRWCNRMEQRWTQVWLLDGEGEVPS